MSLLNLHQLLTTPVALAAASSLLTAAAVAQNDECAGATALPLGATAFDTSVATLSTPTWPCALGGGPDLWYVFTAPVDGNFSIDTCAGNSYDTALEVFTGSCTALVSLSCNDDACGLQSKVGFAATAGDRFYLRVGGYNGQNGTGTLTVQQNFPMLNPANGHYYEVVSINVDWSTANQMASNRTYMGLTGHLATISESSEDQFVYFTLAGGPLGNAWLGGFQDMASPSYSEPTGGWTWVTGEPFGYTNWVSGEPNNGGGQEHYLGYWPADQWNDYTLVSGNVGSFVVEYESSLVGTTYCSPAQPNSTGSPASISAFGSSGASANDLTLMGSDLPSFAFGLFLTSQTQGFVMNPSGSQGHLCLGGAIGRYVGPGQIQQSGNNGQIQLLLDLTITPTPGGLVTVQAGETWNFTAWYRDSVGGSATSNFTDGLEILFQ